MLSTVRDVRSVRQVPLRKGEALRLSMERSHGGEFIVIFHSLGLDQTLDSLDACPIYPADRRDGRVRAKAIDSRRVTDDRSGCHVDHHTLCRP